MSSLEYPSYSMDSNSSHTPEQILNGIGVNDVFDCPGGHELDKYDLKQALSALDAYYKAFRRADMEAVIGKSKPQYQWGDGTAKSLWYEAQHKLQEEQRKRMKDRLNG